MTESEWALRRQLAQTKLELYGAQNAYLQLMAEKANAELAALGDKPPAPESTVEDTVD